SQRAQLVASLPPLNVLTSSYIATQADSPREDRNELAVRLQAYGLPLPAEVASKSHTMFAGLFAPILLAASAAGKLQLGAEDSLLVRRVLREDPAYVTA